MAESEQIRLAPAAFKAEMGLPTVPYQPECPVCSAKLKLLTQEAFSLIAFCNQICRNKVGTLINFEKTFQSSFTFYFSLCRFCVLIPKFQNSFHYTIRTIREPSKHSVHHNFTSFFFPKPKRKTIQIKHLHPDICPIIWGTGSEQE